MVAPQDQDQAQALEQEEKDAGASGERAGVLSRFMQHKQNAIERFRTEVKKHRDYTFDHHHRRVQRLPDPDRPEYDERAIPSAHPDGTPFGPSLKENREAMKKRRTWGKKGERPDPQPIPNRKDRWFGEHDLATYEGRLRYEMYMEHRIVPEHTKESDLPWQVLRDRRNYDEDLARKKQSEEIRDGLYNFDNKLKRDWAISQITPSKQDSMGSRLEFMKQLRNTHTWEQIENLHSLQCYHMTTHTVSVTRTRGKVRSFRTNLLVGNMAGGVGIAKGRGPKARDSSQHAKSRVLKCLQPVHLHKNHTITHRVRIRGRGFRGFEMRPLGPGRGLRAHPWIRNTLHMAGVRDCSVSFYPDKRNIRKLCEATIKALRMQVPIEDQAERDGVNVWNLRAIKPQPVRYYGLQ